MGLIDRFRGAAVSGARLLPEFRGKFRVTRAVHDALLSRPTPLRVRIGDVEFELLGRDLIEFNLLYHRGNSPEIVDTLVDFVAQGARVCWDVGANIGSIALPLAARCPELAIHAFEPSPPVLVRLSRNLGLNPAVAQRVTLHATALSGSTGFAPFFVSSEEINSGVGGLFESANREALGIRIWAMRGDDLIRQGEAPAPELLKIDVEGLEHEVIEGLRETLSGAARMALVMEHETYRFEERGMPADSVVETLRGMGFEMFVIDFDSSRRPQTPADLAIRHDYVAVKGFRGV